jgi:hypothetical protein
MKKFVKLAAVAVLSVGSVALMSTAASAAVVCNQEGECWHTREAYDYKPEFGVAVHPDDWRWSDADHYRWREHEGRGYWRNGVWVTF